MDFSKQAGVSFHDTFEIKMEIKSLVQRFINWRRMYSSQSAGGLVQDSAGLCLAPPVPIHSLDDVSFVWQEAEGK